MSHGDGFSNGETMAPKFHCGFSHEGFSPESSAFIFAAAERGDGTLARGA
jgi:hypothetical protein